MRLRGSYTVENAVLVPTFVLLFVAIVMLDFYLHDTVIIKCIAQNVALAIEMDKENEECLDFQRVSTNYDEYIRKAVENIRIKSIAQRAPGTRMEVSDEKVFVKSHGNNPALMLRLLRKNVTQAEATVRVDKPDEFIRKINAVRRLVD